MVSQDMGNLILILLFHWKSVKFWISYLSMEYFHPCSKIEMISLLVNFIGMLWELMLENTLSSSEKSAMILSLLDFSPCLPYGKSGEIKILQLSGMKQDQSCMFWQHILRKCSRVQNQVNLKFPQTYK